MDLIYFLLIHGNPISFAKIQLRVNENKILCLDFSIFLPNIIVIVWKSFECCVKVRS